VGRLAGPVASVLLPLLLLCAGPQGVGGSVLTAAGAAAAGKLRVGQADVVQVAVAADEKVIPVLSALLASIAENSPNAFVHVVTTTDAAPACRKLVSRFTVAAAGATGRRPLARCVEWRAEAATAASKGGGATSIAEAKSRLKVVSGVNSSACAGLEGCDASRAARLANVLNFARFHLAELLPEQPRVIWMDCDVIVRRPMDDLWKAASASSSSLLVAFAEPGRFGRFYLDGGLVKRLMEGRFSGLSLDMEGESFNDGVIAINLHRWRDVGAQQVVTWLMEQHQVAKPGLWKYGTQPLTMLLGAAFGWSRLDPAAYCGDLGFKKAEVQPTQQAVFLHFDGELKPWKPGGLNGELWWPYAERARAS